ncbi:MAG: hypothetical protein DRQ55_10015 [Planctomycetota bacterium]|nr:MAG: hypothetical protein DRQ55_10015 [Planctomycetota bacterium]
MARIPAPDPTRRIGELAQALGLSSRTLRYWEERSLIPPAARSRCGYRLYDAQHEHAARGIGRLKASGLSLDQIATLAARLGSSQSALVGTSRARDALQGQIQALEDSISLQRELIDELKASLGLLALCNGCEGKPYDGQCLRCLDGHAGRSALPAPLNSLLHAALAAPSRKHL